PDARRAAPPPRLTAPALSRRGPPVSSPESSVSGDCAHVVDAFLPLFEPQPVNRSGARLIHDPSDNGTARRIIPRCSAPYIVEHIAHKFFGGFAIGGDPYAQGKDESVGSGVPE